jgi:hypothetical protein
MIHDSDYLTIYHLFKTELESRLLWCIYYLALLDFMVAKDAQYNIS